MKLIKWEELPPEMQTDSVRKYYDILAKRKGSLFVKRVFDVVCSLILLVILSPVFLILAIAIKIDSPGPVFYRQERITQYGRRFRIHKFRTMVQNADKGSQVTVNNDHRVTRVGRFIRRCRLDEIAQLLDTISGDLTLVGVRPESPRFVAEYSEEMMATLLLPAGVTSLASIYYKDEAEIRLVDIQGCDQIICNVDVKDIHEINTKKFNTRLKNGKIILYRNFDISNLKVKNICFGPTNNYDLTATKIFLAKNKFDVEEIYKSEIPYRN